MLSGDVALPSLRGARILLRPPRPADVADRLAAGRDPEFRRMVGAVGPDPGSMTPSDAARWHERLAREPLGWVIEYEGRCVGEARLHHVDAEVSRAQLAVGLFSPAYRGRRLGTDAVRLVLEYAFGGLGLVVVGLRVLAFNARALACYRRCGFREVGRAPVRLDGEAAEDVLMEASAADAHVVVPAVPA